MTKQRHEIDDLEKTHPQPTLIATYRNGGGSHFILSLIQLFKVSQILGYHFKIYIKDNVVFEDFMQPNKYDWRVSTEIYEKAIADGHLLVFGQEVLFDKYMTNIQNLCENKDYVVIKADPRRNFKASEYKDYHDILFRPSPQVSEAIAFHREMLGNDFIATHFRFQRLLGDFYDCTLLVLNKYEKKALIALCLEHLKTIHTSNPNVKILVMSDSATFLSEADNLDFTYTIPGEIAHTCYTERFADNVWEKFFVEYWLSRESKTIYQIVEKMMYPSSNPVYAATYSGATLIKLASMTKYTSTIGDIKRSLFQIVTKINSIYYLRLKMPFKKRFFKEYKHYVK